MLKVVGIYNDCIQEWWISGTGGNFVLSKIGLTCVHNYLMILDFTLSIGQQLIHIPEICIGTVDSLKY